MPTLPLDDPDLDAAISPLRSLLLRSKNGQKRRRLGRAFGELAGMALASGIPGEVLYDQLLVIVERGDE